jgi:deoxyribodipyrimidine photo-lyase
VRAGNDRDVDPRGELVLYWMIAARRTRWSFSLDRAIERAKELGKPLVVLEPLRAGHRWASDRIHRFVIDGMRDNAARFARAGVAYHPYVEPELGAGKGLFAALARRAAVVITDDFPCFFLPRMVKAAAAQCPVRLELVDSNGLLPMFDERRLFTTARSFRIHWQKVLAAHLAERPRADPLARLALPKLPGGLDDIAKRWPAASPELLARGGSLARLPIDHAVVRVPFDGGEQAARAALARFVAERLPHYLDRNDPDADATSGLSPWLHFGHVAAHEVLDRVLAAEDWSEEKITKAPRGEREQYFGASARAEAFLEQLVTWREIGFNQCAFDPAYERYESLPGWARRSLGEHAKDRREHVYALDRLAAADTHDDVWNAAQRQLVAEGRVHNYLRMVWGKRVLEWTKTPEEALDTLIELNNRYAIDGRDPSSYSGIFWTLGRYDRPWAPERPVYGCVRYMSSARTKQKLDMDRYLAAWGRGPTNLRLF